MDRHHECWMCGAWGAVELDKRGRCVDRVVCDFRAAEALKKAEILGPAFAPHNPPLPPRGTPFRSPSPTPCPYEPWRVVFTFNGIELRGA